MVLQDDIRRHTTPSHRAPELWDLHLRLPVDHRVDLWVRRPGRAPALCLNTGRLHQLLTSKCTGYGDKDSLTPVTVLLQALGCMLYVMAFDKLPFGTDNKLQVGL